MTEPCPVDPGAPIRYFMLSVRAAHPPQGMAGLVELLGSGEKRTFGSAEELVRLVAGWLGRASAEMAPTSVRRA